MPTYTQRYDDFAEDFVRRHPLPYLEQYGVEARLHDALDKAANLRNIVLVLGGKGMGKSVRAVHAREWFDEREARRAERDNSYLPLRVHLSTNARRDTYEETLVGLLLSIDQREPTKERGRRKSAQALRERICELLTKKRIAVILVDEAETLTKHTFDALRDVIALSGDLAVRKGGVGAGLAGTGLVVVGTPESESVLQQHEEYGHRLTEAVRIPEVAIADAIDIVATWMPQAAELSEVETAGFHHVVRVNICRDRSTNMRHLWAVISEYARRLDRIGRLKHAAGWPDVPIDLTLLKATGDDQIDPGPQGAPPRRPRA